jgi:hypothetical protein
MTSTQVHRKLGRFLIVAFVMAQLGCLASRASDITYNFNTTITSAVPTGNSAQSDSIVGTLTTDGTIGVLGTSNILSWNLALNDLITPADDFTLTDSNSTVLEDTGSALSATATTLSFDFGGTGEFLIQITTGPFSGTHYFCFSTGGACIAGESIVPLQISTDGVVATGASEPIGNQPLGPPITPTTGVTPEPATFGLMLTGLLGLSGTIKRKFRS